MDTNTAVGTAVSEIVSQATAFGPQVAGVVAAGLALAFLFWGVPKAVNFFKSIAS